MMSPGVRTAHDHDRAIRPVWATPRNAPDPKKGRSNLSSLQPLLQHLDTSKTRFGLERDGSEGGIVADVAGRWIGSLNVDAIVVNNRGRSVTWHSVPLKPPPANCGHGASVEIDGVVQIIDENIAHDASR